MKCQYVCKLVFGVDILDMNFGAQISSVETFNLEQLSVDSGYVSHCRTSDFDDHF